MLRPRDPQHSVLSLLTWLSVPFIGKAIEAEGEESDLHEVKKWWLWVLNQFFLGNPDSPQCVRVCQVCLNFTSLWEFPLPPAIVPFPFPLKSDLSVSDNGE